MRNLSQSGYTFTPETITEMCSSEWSLDYYHTDKPFMKRFISGKTDNKGVDGRVRFWAEIFHFGNEEVYISKEWYERQHKYFE